MKELKPDIDLRHALEEQIPEMRFNRLPRGGSASVGPSDTIALDACWCGRPMNHDWPGHDEGAPHPRYPE